MTREERDDLHLHVWHDDGGKPMMADEPEDFAPHCPRRDEIVADPAADIDPRVVVAVVLLALAGCLGGFLLLKYLAGF